MGQLIKLALWNANGLAQHSQELKSFILHNQIDVMMISETHFTMKSFLKIPDYNIYTSNYPDGTAHGGTAIIIRSTIKHHELPKYDKQHLQASSVALVDSSGTICISAIYCPPRHIIKNQQFSEFYKLLGHRFIAGGDYNAKHQNWGSRLTTPRGRELMNTIQNLNLQYSSTGEPTYWPSDRCKIPDLLDFCVTKGITRNSLTCISSLDLSSDHSPVLITLMLSSSMINTPGQASLFNNQTNWDLFRYIINERLNSELSMKTGDELDEAVEHLTCTIQRSAWAATSNRKTIKKPEMCTGEIRCAIATKRKLRKIWQNNRTPRNKTKLNQAVQKIKRQLRNERNNRMSSYLQQLSPTEATEYSLWKATQYLKQPKQPIPPIRHGADWARNDQQKAQAFADHLINVFQPHPSDNNEEESEIQEFLAQPFQLSPPIKKYRQSEVVEAIKHHINPKKAPGYDLIKGKVLSELPTKATRMITMIFNAILRLSYFPVQWKVAQIILIAKPGKSPEDVSSYRPISLLPILSKLFEKLFLKRLRPIIEAKKLIPDHQFGFRQNHATVEQIHRVANTIGRSLEDKQYCSAAFLDITQAFDKVWHVGLLYKIKKNLPDTYYRVLKSYLENRHFQVKLSSAYTKLFPIAAGVPQGSVLGPLLYLLYTADLPKTDSATIATFADDTAILASHMNPLQASRLLQTNLYQIQNWLKKWRIKANESKSTHVTFTMRRETCPPVMLNSKELPQKESAKYLGMHLDRRLTWKTHIFMKRKQLGLKFSKLLWLIGKRSQLSLENKLLVYKVIIKPIWTYGIQLWGAASHSNIEILQRFHSKTLRTIVNAPWYVPNKVVLRDINMSSVKDEIKLFSSKYQTRLGSHPNICAVNLLKDSRVVRRLKRFQPLDLPCRFK